MLMTSENAKFVGTPHKRISTGKQQGFQSLEANAGRRLLPDQYIVRWCEIRFAVVHTTRDRPAYPFSTIKLRTAPRVQL